MAKPEQCSENADFNHHHQDCRRGRFNDRWTLICAAGIEFHHAGGVGNRFYAGKREHDSDEAGPVLRQMFRAAVANERTPGRGAAG